MQRDRNAHETEKCRDPKIDDPGSPAECHTGSRHPGRQATSANVLGRSAEMMGARPCLPVAYSSDFSLAVGSFEYVPV